MGPPRSTPGPKRRVSADCGNVRGPSDEEPGPGTTLMPNPHWNPPKVERNQRCPCGSGKKAKKCCLLPSGKLQRDIRIQPLKQPGPAFSNSQCYAGILNDCSHEMSREHYFSESVLKLLGKKIRLTGTPWLAGREKLLPLDAIASRILCKRHNEMLSPLDEEAGRFFSALESMKSDNFEDPSFRFYSLFSGEAIERWLLKVTVGVTYSGSAGRSGGTKIEWRPSLRELEMLFLGRSMPPRCGLYFKAPPYETLKIERRLTFAPVTYLETGQLIACQLSMWAYSFVLPFVGAPAEANAGIFEHTEYRPRWLDFNAKRGIIEISWNDPSLGTAIHITINR